MNWTITQSDAIDFLRSQPAGSVDLVFGSPPYEQARLYLESGQNLGVARKTEDWVAWMVKVFQASLHACKGLVAFVVEGQTRQFRYSVGPALLMADLHRAGVHLRKPPIFHRVGIPGSGGPDWLRTDYEFIVCATNGGTLLWSDNTACGHAPKWAPGGDMSYRDAKGKRRNQWGGTEESNGHRKTDGTKDNYKRPSHKFAAAGIRRAPNGHADGDTIHDETYNPPAIANPGNNIECTYTAAEVAAILQEESDWFHTIVGGGVMGGDEFSSQNEAPFPEALAAFFVQSFCPPGGLVCDPFSGSGTTGAVAVRNGRRFTGCDLRASQVELGTRRIGQETPLGLYGDVP